MVGGNFPYHVHVSMVGWMTYSRHQLTADSGLSRLLEQLDFVCERVVGMPLTMAQQNKTVYFKMRDHAWVIGFKNQEPFDALLKAIGKDFSGHAYGIVNKRHLQQILDFKAMNWEILPEGLDFMSHRNTKFKLYVRITTENTEIVEKFLARESIKNEIMHLHTDVFHVLFFDNVSLVLQAKLAFPSIDKIEHYINVDELGEANE